MMLAHIWLCILVVSASSVLVKLHADWPEAPFALQLIEAVSSYNESLYAQAVRALYQRETEADDWDEDDEEGFEANQEDEGEQAALTDKSYYEAVTGNLLPVAKGMVDLNLVNKIYTPRIVAHYKHYEREVEPSLGSIEKQCAKDSFGNEITDPLASWVKYGNKIYCSDADLYALQLSKVSEKTLEFDRVVGEASKKPLLVLYGAPESPRFQLMFETLYQFSSSDKLRFTWRYVPLEGYKDRASIPGYGAVITPKEALNGTKKNSKVKYNGDLLKFLADVKQEGKPLRALDSDEYHDLSVKITALILEQPGSARYGLLEEILNNFPLYAPYLKLINNPVNFETVKSVARLNEKKGASEDSVGLYLNGASVHKLEMDLPHVVKKLKTEVELIHKMNMLGFTTEQSKLLFSKYALMSAFKEVQYRSGDRENRYAIYKHEYDASDPSSGGLVYFNNIEKDDPYDLYDINRKEAYLGREASMLQFGQVPPLRENAHELAFAIHFSSSIQVKVFFTFAKIILDRNLPQQVGVIPLVESDEDEKVAEKFYHILSVSDAKEAFALLYQYYEAGTEAEKQAVLDKVEVSEESKGKFKNYKRTVREFSLDAPSVIVNGVIHDMKSPWQTAMTKQMGNDVRLLQQKIRNGDDTGKPLKAVLFQDSKDTRNSRVSPKDLSNIRYKEISSHLLENSYSFRKINKLNDAPGTFWLIGDFNSKIILSQFAKLLEVLETYEDKSLEIRVFSISEDNSLLINFFNKYGKAPLTDHSIEKLRAETLKAKSKFYTKILPSQARLLEQHQIQLHQAGMLFNSRYFKLTEVFEPKELIELIEFEQRRRLSIFKDLTDAYPDIFRWKGIMHFKKSGYDDFAWFDLVSSVVARSFFLEDSQFQADVDRFDFSSLDFTNALNITDQNPMKFVDVLAIVNPLTDASQKIVSIIKSLKDLLFVNVQILMQPLEAVPESKSVDRFYSSAFETSLPRFNDQGAFIGLCHAAAFDALVSSTKYSSELDTPSRWLYVKGSIGDLDHDEFEPGSVHELNYTLDSLIVEGYAKDVKTAQSIATLTLEVTNGEAVFDAIVMHTLGYVQFQLKPDVWNLEIQKGSKGRQIYNLLSASDNKYDVNDLPLERTELAVFSLHGNVIHPRLQEKSEKEIARAKKEVSVGKNADVNVFSLASGKLYERFLSAMMVSVKKHTKSTVKFWLLRNFLSAEFVNRLPILADNYGFEYEFVSYKWPLWLRQQKEKFRQVWGYKILFLDVLFPNQLEKVIFVDADQIARADLQELVDTDLKGKVYGFPPMCDSREETEGYRFWKQGYWKNVLKNDLVYHISALFVVDLKQFRMHYAGDRLRTHYQKLSSDKDSLANLDQDLPNNMQRLIPIHTLHQDWLWCETWCSDETKDRAKMIDLCSDPFRKEGKLERVQRLIPEWVHYDAEIQRLQKNGLENGSTANVPHDEL